MSCIFLYPLAAQQREVLDWAIGNLAAPNSLHLCRHPASEIDLSGSPNFIQKVERWRVRDRDQVDEEWAVPAIIHAAAPLEPLDGLLDAPRRDPTPEALREERRGPAPRRGGGDLRRAEEAAEQPRGPRDEAMDAVSHLGRELLDEEDPAAPPRPPPERGPPGEPELLLPARPGPRPGPRAGEPELLPPARPGLRAGGRVEDGRGDRRDGALPERPGAPERRVAPGDRAAETPAADAEA